jgi:hypothetical protein
MKANEGNIDRIIRIIIGLAIIVVVGFVIKSWWGVIGIVPLVTGLISRCPMYSIFGISTCPVSDDKKVKE